MRILCLQLLLLQVGGSGGTIGLLPILIIIAITIGKVIKGIGILVGVLGLGVVLQSRSTGAGLVTLLVPAFVGALPYCVGVLVAAQGQILLATLDTAVNSSPFLTNEDKAKAMSL